MKNIITTLCSILAICSCSKGDYVDAIPSTATALVAIDGSTPLLSDIDDIDTSHTVYLFELAGGEMGLCALDTEGDPLIAFLPTSVANDKEHQEKLIDHMKECDSENSIRTSQLWKHLEELSGNTKSHVSDNSKCKMHMVAQTNVLPKQMQACLLIGAPKGTDPTDILLEGELEYSDSTLTLNGHTSAYDDFKKQALDHAFDKFQPLTINSSNLMQHNALLGIFMNIQGNDFVPLLQQNKSLNMMLMGSNAIDKIRNNKGDMAVIGSLDNKWEVKTNLKPENLEHKAPKLLVCLNMESLPKELEAVIGFMTAKINKIVYKVE